MQLVDLRTHNHSARCCLGLLLAMAMSAGCQKKLFDEKDPRNQFEIHDNLRQDFTPMEVPNAFGEPQPALRARLAPRQ